MVPDERRDRPTKANPSCKQTDLSRRVQDALNAITLEVIWKCARRARDYMRGYRVLGGGELPKKDIEEQANEQKRHRDVLNFSSAWIRSLLALYQPNAGAASTQ